MRLYDEKKQEVFHIAGDMDHGVACNTNLTNTAIGKPHIRYKDFIMEADVYAIDGKLMVHMYCPRCRNVLKIDSDKKVMSYDRGSGKLSIEPFECTWELGERGAERIAFGLGLCRWRVGVVDNIAKDA